MKTDGSNRNERGAMNGSETFSRKCRETSWMLLLRTVILYGLNTRIGDDPMNKYILALVDKIFFSLARSYLRVRREICH